ncbi:MAG: hypothetical protein RL660_709 [Bacteroidota bacterium]|jgi:hypothetical protein
MFIKKDYTGCTKEQLLAEQNQIKRQQQLSTLGIGVLMGIMVYGIINKGFGFLHLAIPALLMGGIYRNSQVQKENFASIEEELSRLR